MLFYADFQALYTLDGKPYPGQAKKPVITTKTVLEGLNTG